MLHSTTIDASPHTNYLFRFLKSAPGTSRGEPPIMRRFPLLSTPSKLAFRRGFSASHQRQGRGDCGRARSIAPNRRSSTLAPGIFSAARRGASRACTIPDCATAAHGTRRTPTPTRAPRSGLPHERLQPCSVTRASRRLPTWNTCVVPAAMTREASSTFSPSMRTAP